MNTQQSESTMWWRSAAIYQIYPRSFADSNGDGIGDLPGIVARLDHLVELGVDAVWVSPFYPSPQADAGYDVADYRDVDPVFGTLADADRLIAAARSRGLRIIIDLVPNHTSSAHPWFVGALDAGPGTPERDRYIFRDGRGADGRQPPNNWRSVFGGPAWTRVGDGQWYLHLFDSGQPDLNWDNPLVRKEFEDILRFWLERGVDGFRVDVAHGLVKQPDLPDWDYPALTAPHAPMWDQDGVHEIYRSWRRILREYGDDRMLVAEAWAPSVERIASYVRPDEMHQAFNFEYLQASWDAAAQREVISRSLEVNAAVGAPTTWVLSNHDVIRHSSRFGLDVALTLETGINNGIGVRDPQPDRLRGLRRARAATLLMLALPGSAYLYQGEELGLPEHTTLPDEVRQDPAWRRSGFTQAGRDGCRVPLPWRSDAPSYGFGPAGASWLPQAPIWAEYALDRQRQVPGSTYEMYRSALHCRRSLGLAAGVLSWMDVERPRDVLAFRNGGVVVVTNFGAEPVSLRAVAGDLATVVLSSVPLEDDDRVPGDVTVWVTR